MSRAAPILLLITVFMLALCARADAGPDGGLDAGSDADGDTDTDADADVDAAPDAADDAGEAGPIEPAIEMVCKCDVVGARAGRSLIDLLW